MMLTSKDTNKALENLNDKLLEILKVRGKIAPYLLSPLSKIINPENIAQFTLIKDHNSNRVDDLLKHITIPGTLYANLLTFRDTGRMFELKGDLLKPKTANYFFVDLFSLSDKKLMYDFAKEMYFDVKATCKKSDRDRTLISLLKSPGLMVSASGVSNTIFLLSDPKELCNRVKLLLQEKQAGKISHKITEEIVTIVDKLIEYKCINKKQHKQIFIKCNLLHTKKK